MFKYCQHGPEVPAKLPPKKKSPEKYLKKLMSGVAANIHLVSGITGEDSHFLTTTVFLYQPLESPATRQETSLITKWSRRGLSSVAHGTKGFPRVGGLARCGNGSLATWTGWQSQYFIQFLLKRVQAKEGLNGYGVEMKWSLRWSEMERSARVRYLGRSAGVH